MSSAQELEGVSGMASFITIDDQFFLIRGYCFLHEGYALSENFVSCHLVCEDYLQNEIIYGQRSYIYHISCVCLIKPEM